MAYSRAGQMQFRPPSRGYVTAGIQSEIFQGKQVPRRLLTACQHVDTRQQFLIGEGFDQIIVRARVQAAHTVLYGVARGQKQHGRIRAPLPHAAYGLQAIHFGHHESSTITS